MQFWKDVVALYLLCVPQCKWYFILNLADWTENESTFCHQCLLTVVFLSWPATCPSSLPVELKLTKLYKGTKPGHKRAFYSFIAELKTIQQFPEISLSAMEAATRQRGRENHNRHCELVLHIFCPTSLTRSVDSPWGANSCKYSSTIVFF